MDCRHIYAANISQVLSPATRQVYYAYQLQLVANKPNLEFRDEDWRWMAEAAGLSEIANPIHIAPHPIMWDVIFGIGVNHELNFRF